MINASEMQVDRAHVTRLVLWRILPLLTMMYSVQTLDKINIGTAALRMNHDLGISQTVFGLAVTTFQLSYILFQLPSNLALYRFGARLWLSFIMACWGVVSALGAFVHDGNQLLILRFLLGVAEAGMWPGILFYMTLWLPREVRSRGLIIAVLPLASIFGSPLSGAIIQFGNGWLGFAGWQMMFIIEGLATVLLSLVTLKYLTARPSEAAWLKPAEASWLEEVNSNGESEQITAASLGRITSVLANPRTITFALAVACLNMGLLTMLVFTPQMVAAFSQLYHVKLSVFEVSLLSGVPYLFAYILSYIWCRHSDLTGERMWHAVIPTIVVALGITYLLFVHELYAMIIGLSLCGAGLIGGLGPLWQQVSETLRSAEAAIAIAVVNMVGQCGPLVGPAIIGRMTDLTGSYHLGLASIAVVALLAGALTIVGTVLQRRLNGLAPATLKPSAS